MRFLSRRAALAGLFGAAFAPHSGEAQPRGEPDTFAWRDVPLRAEAFSGFSVSEPMRREFGKLTFLGGLELRGQSPDFGGISSLAIEPDGRGFIAISDHAHWMTGRFTTDGTERLTGIEMMRLSAMQAPNGKRMKNTRYFDSEGLARQGNRLYVSVERVHQILRYEIGPNGPAGRGTPVPVPEEFRTLNGNEGIESLGFLPRSSRFAGAMIAIAENAPKGTDVDAIPGWLIGGPQPGKFHVKRRQDFNITDLGFLPGGDMLLLERRFSPFWGVAMRLRRIALASIAPGAMLDGETLIEANMAYQVDNMEALGLHRAADGRVIITILSDDNFSVIQRNLVLRFAYSES